MLLIASMTISFCDASAAGSVLEIDLEKLGNAVDDAVLEKLGNEIGESSS